MGRMESHEMVAGAGRPSQLRGGAGPVIPAVIRRAGDRAARRFLEFFAATIRNANTREAYYRACCRFLGWCEENGINDLDMIEPLHVAAYVEGICRDFSKPTVKQHLAAIRMLFDWLVTGGVIALNPASAVRGPTHVVKRGKTPVLTTDDARRLLDSIETETIIGLRDRALIALMIYSFARVSAAIAMKVEDYYRFRNRCWVRLHEKGGKRHEMPAHHHLEAYIGSYLDAAQLRGQKKSSLFRSSRGGKLVEHGLTRVAVFQMVRKRASDASLDVEACCHMCRATGITAYMENGGLLENAQAMASHESPRTTKLYDRTSDEITIEEVEKIII
jgi:site-specific recombinase XerD